MSEETTSRSEGEAVAAPEGPHKAIRFNLCSRSNDQNTAPVLDFIEDVPAFLAKQGLEEKADLVLEELNRLYRGLKTHQQKLVNEKAELERRLPDLKENVRIIKQLKEQDQTKLRFMAADSVWVDGVVEKPTDGSEPKVALWLGANVMMEYGYDEAETLLSRNISNSESIIAGKGKELTFLKGQLTMCEVTISRFYNYEVSRKRKLREAEAASRS